MEGPAGNSMPRHVLRVVRSCPLLVVVVFNRCAGGIATHSLAASFHSAKPELKL